MNRTIFTLDALPIAHFEDNVPHFLKHMLKLAIPLKIWVPAPSEVSLCRICSPKIAVFRPFFGRKWSLTAKPSTFDPIVLYIIGKLCIWQVWNSGGKSIFNHHWSARIFVTHPDWIATLIRFLVLYNVHLQGIFELYLNICCHVARHNSPSRPDNW